MPDPPRSFALFSYGFRPFFLLAGAYAVIMIPWWMFGYAQGSLSFSGLPPMYWHSSPSVQSCVPSAWLSFPRTIY